MDVALPSIESTGGRAFWFDANDGARMRGATWPARAGGSAGTALLLGGRTEFIEKNLEATEALLQRGFAVWSLDWRGQGLSARALPDRHKGYIEDYRQFLDDLTLFVERYVAPEVQEPLVMVAHSMGGHIGLRFLHDQPGRFASAAFSSPLIGIHFGGAAVGLIARAIAWIANRIGYATYYAPGTGPYGESNRRFVGNVLTSDPDRFAGMLAQIDRNPDLALGGPTLGWLDATLRSISTLTEPSYARAITTPLLIASAGQDKVVEPAAQERLCRHIPNGRFVSVEGAQHELMIEADRYRLRFWELVDAHFAATLG